MIKILSFFLVLLITGCTVTKDVVAIPQRRGAPPIVVSSDNPAVTAYGYYGMNESTHRAELRKFTGVDPARTEWCAAFANAVLEESGIQNNESHKHPLLARSFLEWGQSVNTSDIRPGDLVIFPRGNVSWQGHVGFYLRNQTINGTEYWLILGGNQDNRVSVAFYKAKSALGIRRSDSI